METTTTVMQQITQAASLLDDPLVSATDLDLEVLAAQVANRNAPELAREVIAELQARKWAKPNKAA